MSKIDYIEVLSVINGSDDPPSALAAFVAQERDHAAWVARQPAFECSVCDYTSDEYGDTHTHPRTLPDVIREA